jgi:hypothetical protein
MAEARPGGDHSGIHPVLEDISVKPVTFVAAVVFWLVAVAHLVRVVFGWEVDVNGVAIPSYLSVVACVVAGWLGYMVIRENRGRHVTHT